MYVTGPTKVTKQKPEPEMTNNKDTDEVLLHNKELQSVEIGEVGCGKYRNFFFF